MNLTARILSLRSNGVTYRRISEIVGVSKNTVTGKISRSKMPKIATTKPRQPMPPRVIETVTRRSNELGFDPRDILSGDVSRDTSRARHEIMRAVRDEIVLADGKPPSYPLIGRWFGRDHATVHQGVKRARERRVGA